MAADKITRLLSDHFKFFYRTLRLFPLHEWLARLFLILEFWIH